MKHKLYWLIFAFMIAFLSVGCDDDAVDDTTMPPPDTLAIDFDTIEYNPTAYQLQLPPPPILPPVDGLLPADNPMTEEGVQLGRMLFYDPILSADSSLACAGCHNQAFAFTDDNNQFSDGIDGIFGNRNAMPLFNMIWMDRFFWDGRAPTIEAQALGPVPNPIEMHLPWEEAIERLMNHLDYRVRFYEAFGIESITKEDVAKAIAQFERTLISGTSKYDLALTPGTGVEFTEQEELGFQLFVAEGKGDCAHCHFAPFFGDNRYRNNGITAAETIDDFPDIGLGEVTENPLDYGLFKTPSLRNIGLTAPYMHDGRFASLKEVMEHYAHGIEDSPTLDFIIASKFGDGNELTDEEQEAVIAFLHTLTDTTFTNNPAHANPF